MTKHIDTLNEWYENAEQITRENMPRDGDTIMYPRAGGAYTIEPATYGWVESIVRPDDDVRILHRAPKPEPAWHDAKAVLAHDGTYREQVFARGLGGLWSDGSGEGIRTESLHDVTPLIEQKVTDEMVIRARGSLKRATGYDYAYAIVQDALTAALGLETA